MVWLPVLRATMIEFRKLGVAASSDRLDRSLNQE